MFGFRTELVPFLLVSASSPPSYQTPTLSSLFQCQSEKVRIPRLTPVPPGDAYSTIGKHRFATKVRNTLLLLSVMCIQFCLTCGLGLLVNHPSLKPTQFTCLQLKVVTLSQDMSVLRLTSSINTKNHFILSVTTMSPSYFIPSDSSSASSFCSVVPYTFLFRSTSFSAVQPHSPSSSLSSIELVSASDDIHRFSVQVTSAVSTRI